MLYKVGQCSIANIIHCINPSNVLCTLCQIIKRDHERVTGRNVQVYKIFPSNTRKPNEIKVRIISRVGVNSRGLQKGERERERERPFKILVAINSRS